MASSASDDATTEFDPAEVESAFGLAPGSLKDVKTQEEAIEAVRQMTDKTLIAGLGLEHQSPAAPAAKAAATTTEKPAAPAVGTTAPNAEIDALRAELAEVKGYVKQQTEASETQLLVELNTRIDAEIDSWASAKYGVGKQRNFKQTKAYKEVRNLARTHVAGLQATGQPIPKVEAMLRQVRLHDDETFTPATAKSTAALLGTPGSSKSSPGAKDAPANIHQALMANRS